MDEQHIDAINTLTAIHWRLLSNPDTCPPVRAAVMRIDDATTALADITAGDFEEIEVEELLPRGPARDWILLSGRKRRPGVYDPSQH